MAVKRITQKRKLGKKTRKIMKGGSGRTGRTGKPAKAADTEPRGSVKAGKTAVEAYNAYKRQLTHVLTIPSQPNALDHQVKSVELYRDRHAKPTSFEKIASYVLPNKLSTMLREKRQTKANTAQSLLNEMQIIREEKSFDKRVENLLRRLKGDGNGWNSVHGYPDVYAKQRKREQRYPGLFKD
jgi:hypothetical protein